MQLCESLLTPLYSPDGVGLHVAADPVSLAGVLHHLGGVRAAGRSQDRGPEHAAVPRRLGLLRRQHEGTILVANI